MSEFFDLTDQMRQRDDLVAEHARQQRERERSPMRDALPLVVAIVGLALFAIVYSAIARVAQ